MSNVHISRKWIMIMVFALSGLTNIFSHIDNNLVNKNENLEEISTPQEFYDWFVGVKNDDGSVSVFFQTSDAIFKEFISNNNVTYVKVSVIWINNNGREIKVVGVDEIDLTKSIENWVTIANPADLDNGSYHVSIVLDQQTCKDYVPVTMITEEPPVEEETPPVTLPDFNCGDTYNREGITNTSLITSIEQFNSIVNTVKSQGEDGMIDMGGFPLLLKGDIGFANGKFHGTAYIPLPFTSKVMQVDFVDVAINEELQIIDGQITATSGDLQYSYLEDVDPGTTTGPEICVPPPPPPGYDSEGFDEVTRLNEWGFDSEGNYMGNEGQQYDPNGFDADGNHKETGNAYNEQGCSREGKDKQGNVCDPSAGPSAESEAFAQSITEDMPTKVDNALNTFITSLNQKLADLDCQGIRNELETLMPPTNEDRHYFFGDQDQYLSKGMHLNFTDRPKTLELQVDGRDQTIIDIEKNHVALYDCDRQEYAIDKILETINGLSEQAKADLSQQLLDIISKWNETTLGQNQDDEALQAWILAELGDILREMSQLDDSYKIGYHQEKTIKNILEDDPIDWNTIFSFDRSHYGSLASSTDIFDDPANRLDMIEEINLAFKKGDREILGIHRAFYLEAMHQHNMINESENALPIRIDKTVGNKTVSIFLDNITLGVDGAYLDAFLILDDPESGRRIVLEGSNIGFGPTGLVGESTLGLAPESDPIAIRLNNAALLRILPGGTFAKWDCEGFQSVSVAAEIEFCRDFITPVGADLKPIADETVRYKLEFSLVDISSWLEFSMLVNAPAFVVTGHEDVVWEVGNMLIDMSSEDTPTFVPPIGYESAFLEGNALLPQWKGFYMESFSATFSTELKKGDQPITISAQNVLIDQTGFSGIVEAENVITWGDNGNIGGWGFTMDRFNIKILHNQFSGSGLGGEIQIPIFEDDQAQALEYTAVVYPGSEYRFSVTPPAGALKAPIFKATVTIEENSRLDIGYVNGEFITKAHLNGTMSIGSEELDAGKVSFKGFEVSNKAPYFSPGIWGIPSGDLISVGMEGFEFTLGDIQPYNPGEGKLGLGFEATFDIAREVEITAKGYFGLVGRLDESTGRQRWLYDGLDIQGASIDATIGETRIHGAVAWYGNRDNLDPIFGKGFIGEITMEIGKLDLLVESTAQFGKAESTANPGELYNYFFVDAGIKFTGAPIATTGVLTLTGFNGGLSYNMDIEKADGTYPELTLGIGLSGTRYTPNEERFISLKAGVYYNLFAEDVINGTASFFISFNDGFGIAKLGFIGVAKFLEDFNEGDTNIDPDQEEQPTVSAPVLENDAVLSAYMDLTLDFTAKTFSGNLKTYLLLKGNNGKVLMEGIDNGKMVDASIFFGDSIWYAYIGTPEAPGGVRFNIGNSSGSGVDVTATAYFDIGNKIPPFPDLPEEVKQITGQINKNEALRQSGKGVAFGAALNVSMGARIAGILEASLSAGLGFDIMLKKYENVQCTDGPLGINGWYANGQMWAYISGALKVGGVPILEAALAAVLQASLPKPFHARATVGVKVKVLFAQVQKSLTLEIGKSCGDGNFDGAIDMDIITLMVPDDAATGVETNVRPEAHLALQLDRPYKASYDGGTVEYETKLVSTLLLAQGYQIPHTVQLTNERQSIQIIPDELLPGNTVCTLDVKLNVLIDGTPEEIAEQVIFTTGPSLPYIPESNVAAGYPANGMANFYPGEYNQNQGFIRLISGQPELLYNIPDGYAQKVRISTDAGQEVVLDYTYDPVQKEIRYDFDPSSFAAETFYKLEIVRFNSAGEEVSTDAVANAFNRSNDNGEYTEPENEEVDKSPYPDGVIYQSYFRSSEYTGIKESLSVAMNRFHSTNASKPAVAFDFFELQGETDGSTFHMEVDRNDVSTWLTQIEQKYTSMKNIAGSTCKKHIYDYKEEEVLAIGFQYHSLPELVNGNHYSNSAPISLQQSMVILDPTAQKQNFFMSKERVQGCLQMGNTSNNTDANNTELQNLTFPELNVSSYDINCFYKLPTGQVIRETKITIQK